MTRATIPLRPDHPESTLADQREFYDLIHHHDPGRGPDRITAVFVARSWSGEAVFVAQPWSGERHNAEPDKHEGLFRVSLERPSPDRHPHTAMLVAMLTHGPSYRATNWPAGGAR